MRPILTMLATVFVSSALLRAEDPKPGAKADVKPTGDAELVQRVISARREYQQSLVALYQQYEKTGDRERTQWAEDELKAFHVMTKPSYRLDIGDVPPPTLEAKANVKEANELFLTAAKYKDRGTGNEYVLNQKRAELLFREILDKHPTSDKIADVAYQLGELYEGKAFRQYDRAAAYFERAYQWRKGTRTDARLRAASLYDKVLNERSKAIELYKEEIAHDTDADLIKLAEKRLSELTSRGGGGGR